MRPDLWLAAPIQHALGRALGHFLWQGALLAAVLRVALYLGAERSARWRHQAATACLFAMPFVFGVTVALSLGGGHPSLAPPPPAPPIVPQLTISQGAPVAPVDWLAWVAPLWMAGAMVFFAVRFAGWVQVDLRRRRGVCAAPIEWQKRLCALAAAVRVSRPVELLESCLAGVPQVIGHWRPAILMPLGALAGLGAEQVEAILIHELAHIRRADYLIGLAQSAIEGLFFFHPAVWWTSAVVRSEREYACDDVAMALRPNARAYAAALTTLEQSRWPALQPAAGANGGNLMRRIRRILGEPAPARVPSARASAVAGALVLVAGAAIALVAWPAERSVAQSNATAESAAEKVEASADAGPAPPDRQQVEKRLAATQEQIQKLEQTVERAQELIERDAAAADRAVRDGDGRTAGLAQAEEQMRKAEALLQQLQGAKLLDLLQQQERAMREAETEMQRLNDGKLAEALRQQQQQLARAASALRQGWAAAGDKPLADVERQLEQAQKALEQLSGAWSQQRGLRAQAQTPETARLRATGEAGSAYDKWLNEDAIYIIGAEERRGFLALQSDAERDRFIESFWQRRDPAPGDAQHPFQQEHYRRIAYANEHFASGAAGWKTDRGRIYIVYGPPDEVEDHRSESAPRQTWRYRHIEGLGYGVEVEFTDPGKTGDYRMAAAPASRGSYWQVMAGVSDAAGFTARSLQAKGFPAITCDVRADRTGLTQVLVGPYADEAALAKAKAALEAAGFHPVRPR